MFRRITFAVGAAAGSAVVVVLLAGTGKWPSAGLKVFVQQWAGRPPMGTVAGKARGAFRQAVARVSATRAHDSAAGGTPATSGGVIPLETVPIDELSEWELDLLTTPDS